MTGSEQLLVLLVQHLHITPLPPHYTDAAAAAEPGQRARGHSSGRQHRRGAPARRARAEAVLQVRVVLMCSVLGAVWIYVLHCTCTVWGNNVCIVCVVNA